MRVNEKIKRLRELMAGYGLDAYIITSSDPHMSEYVAEHWMARSWITGFTGSAGTFVATTEESGLWTDGRYYIQAEKQLEGSEIKLFKMGSAGIPTVNEWLEKTLHKGRRVGFSPKMVSVAAYKDMEEILSNKGIHICKDYDLIDELWEDRPGIPSARIFAHEVAFTGLTAREKLDKVRGEMKKAGAACYLICSLDDIAWLFNIRGDDIPFVSVAICYALVSLEEAYLFIDGGKVPGEVREILERNGVAITGYEQVKDRLADLEKGSGVAFDPKRTNCWLFDSISPDCRKKEVNEITAKLKAVKNETELANFRKCQVSDGIAMVRFLIWLEKNIGSGEITEVSVSEKLEHFRRQQENNIGPSFTTIAAYMDHGAMMHYSATEESKYVLKNRGLMVVDSGGQYLCGTTDITRTIVFDEITEEERHDFTMVLKAHISLAAARFLYGATGSNLDILARKPLWDIGLDYKCGTGHGVGYCLSVHEGPQGFSQVPNVTKLEKGMVVTIEPGIYREGKHGVRTENMVLVVEDEKTEFGQFMKFETMSYCPISLKGIDARLLTDSEKAWLNNYHSEVYETLSPFLAPEDREWLRENTRSI